MYEELKKRLELAHRILHMEGLAEDTYRGHVTAKDGDHVYIKRWALGFEDVTSGDFLGVDAEGNLVDGEGRLHSELPLHLGIYRRRPEITAVVHVHPHHSLLLSAVWTGRLKIITQNGMHFCNGVPYHDSAELINSRESGQELAGLMGDALVVLMRNHGIVTAGRTLEEAVVLAIDFEKAAREHLEASVLGGAHEVEVETARQMSERIFPAEQYRMMWAFYCRKLKRRTGER